VLACPWCMAPDLTSVRPPPKAGRIIDGSLNCANCGKTTEVRSGIWHAMGPHTMHRTVAQFSNVLPPVPQLYERVWRKRSLSLLSREPFPIERELAELTAAMQPGPGRLMVDIACSEGLYARELARNGSPVLAIDHSLPFLRRTALRARELPVAPVHATAQHLPIVTGSLAGAAIGGSMNEIGDQPAAVTESARVLRPGGEWFSMHLEPAQTTVGRIVQRLVRSGGVNFPSSLAMLSWLNQSGFEVSEVKRTGIVTRVSARRT
jgi:SAM-dependent methyltransferase